MLDESSCICVRSTKQQCIIIEDIIIPNTYTQNIDSYNIMGRLRALRDYYTNQIH